MRVLVADDDLGARLVARTVIEGLGHECSTASDGEEAWRLVEARPPDVLVTDWVMPGVDGAELCRRIRRASSDAYTYIVVVTSLSDRRNVLSGMEAGADDYLVKPLDPFDLETRLLAARRVTSLHAQMARYRADLAALADTDPLTKLGNRRSLDAHLRALDALSRRHHRAYSVALLDVDHFKAYNDSHGHPAGDQVLRRVAACLTALTRESDGVYRYGGEEFLVLMPEQTAEGARPAIERIRRAVEALAMERRDGPGPGVVTLSAGIAGFCPDLPLTGAQLIEQADRALYAAKATGRNAVVTAPGGVTAARARETRERGTPAGA